MKKFLSLLLAMSLSLSLAACGGDKTTAIPDDARDEIASSEQSSAPSEAVPEDDEQEEEATATPSEYLIPAEELFNANLDEEEYQFLKGLQGSYQAVDGAPYSFELIADNTWYSGTDLMYEFPIEVEHAVISAAFDRDTVMNVFGEGVAYGVSDENEVVYEALPVNLGTEHLMLNGSLRGVQVAETVDDVLAVRNYQQTTEGDMVHQETRYPTCVGYDIHDKETQAMSFELVVGKKDDNVNRFYAIMENGVCYELSYFGPELMETMLKESFGSNVADVHSPAFGNMTVPLFSRVGDDAAVYSAAPGESILDWDDNFEIAINMPEGHVPADIVECWDMDDDKLLIQFSNGDFYRTKAIQKTGTTSYDMIYMEELSEGYRSGEFKDVAVCMPRYSMAVLLLDNNGYLFAYELD